MFKRLVSLVLALALCVSAAAPAAWAQETIPGLEAMPNSNNSEMQPLLDVMNSPEMQAFFDSNPEFKTAFDQMIGDIKPEAETLDPSLPRETRTYTLELEPGETKKIEIMSTAAKGISADLNQDRVFTPAKSSNESVATATVKTWNDNSDIPKDYITFTIKASKNAKTPSEATITATTVSDGRSASGHPDRGFTYTAFEPFRADDWIINVKVDKKISPPKVELRLVPGNTTKLVTGSHKETEILDISNKIIDAAFDKLPDLLKAFELTPAEFRAVEHARKANRYGKRLKLFLERPIATVPRFVAKMLPNSLGGLTIYETGNIYIPEQAIKKFVEENLKSKDTAWKPKIAAYGKITAKTLLKLSPVELAASLINEALKKIKVPRVDPEIYLEVIVTNPDNSVPLYYDINIDSPRVEHEGKELTRHTPLFVLEKTEGLAAKSRAYNSQVIQPENGNKNIHLFSLNPELVYNESDPNLLASTLKRYISDITVSGSWSEWKGEDEKIPGGKYKESIQLEVISLLGPKSEYQQMEHFFSDMMETVVNRWKSITELPQLSDSAFVELLDSMPVGTPLMTPIDKIPPKTPVISAPDKLMSPLQ